MAKFVVFFSFVWLGVTLTTAFTPQDLVIGKRNLIEGLDENYQIIVATLERGYRSLRLFLTDINMGPGEEIVSELSAPYEHPAYRRHNHLNYSPLLSSLKSRWHPWWLKRYSLH